MTTHYASKEFHGKLKEVVIEAIKTVGLGVFKRTSMFMSNNIHNNGTSKTR